jgi:hypothetical protein
MESDGKPGDPFAGFVCLRRWRAPMPTPSTVRHSGVQLTSLCLAIVFALAGMAERGLARQTASEATGPARVSIVQGIAGARPLDIYIDGTLALIGVLCPDTSAVLQLSGGEHQFAVVPTGAAPDAAIVSGSIDVAAGTRQYATLLGTSDDAAVGLFAVDERPLEAGQARFRVINGSPDSGQIVPAFSGGEAVAEGLGFGDAMEYVAVDAGTYDIDLLDSSGAVLLTAPQVVLAEGSTNDLIIVGQVADDSLQVVTETVNTGAQRVSGHAAQIVTGTCDNPGDSVADLGLVRQGQGDTVGSAGGQAVENGFALANVPFAALTDTPHAVTVAGGEAASGPLLACADIGGRLTDTGSLVIALHAPRGQEPTGVAVLAPGLETPDTTGVSVFLIGAALPAAEGDAITVKATPTA